MCGKVQGAHPEIVDTRKIVENIWDMTENTKDVPALINRLQGILNFEERYKLNWLQDEKLKCFSLYGKFIREHDNVELSNTLLKALRATGNNKIADRIIWKESEEEDETGNEEKITNKTMTGLTLPPEKNQPETVKSPRTISYEVNGKNKLYTTTESLRISKSIAHKITNLTLNNIQVSILVLKEALKPCVSLENLDLKNVDLLYCDAMPSSSSSPGSESQTNSETTNSVIQFPRLKTFQFHNDNESSNAYAWNTILFFSILGNGTTTTTSNDLLHFWKSQTKIDIRCESMTVKLNTDDPSTVFISLPKKQFYNAPGYIPYITQESIKSFFTQSGYVKNFTCLLPKEFDKIHFNDLPNCSNLHISGLDINYSPEEGNSEVLKSYKNVHFENCVLSQMFVDEISTIMTVAYSIKLHSCRLENSDGADINISLVE